MKIFKFGGASVKDVEAVKNVANILRMFPNDDLIVVISAMGKITNALERLVNSFFYKKEKSEVVLSEIKKFHFDIIDKLFSNKTHPVNDEINNTFVELEWAIEGEPEKEYDCVYDQIVSVGELLSTKIVSAYLNESGIKNSWKDVRDFIKTDNTYREGKVDWSLTEKLISEKNFGSKDKISIVQGFIGTTSENFTTTLGREGSDYTAAIFAYCTNAESVTIWKDVPGVLNADPKWFSDTKLIDQLSYHDAIELSYYGATVIHPKTIKPLQNKAIPLYVRSFVDPKAKGTVINETQTALPVPCFIFKIDQVLISILPKDFSFIVEENLGELFQLFSDHGIKANTMQNSAISFSVCIDDDEKKLPELIAELKKKYRVLYNDKLELVTIRYYDQATIDRVCIDKNIFLEVKSRYTVQIVMKNK